jgi:hypothetical protein
VSALGQRAASKLRRGVGQQKNEDRAAPNAFLVEACARAWWTCGGAAREESEAVTGLRGRSPCRTEWQGRCGSGWGASLRIRSSYPSGTGDSTSKNPRQSTWNFPNFPVEFGSSTGACGSPRQARAGRVTLAAPPKIHREPNVILLDCDGEGCAPPRKLMSTHILFTIRVDLSLKAEGARPACNLRQPPEPVG